MGYPAACLLTSLPPTATRVPNVLQLPLQARAELESNTNTQRHLMQWRTHVYVRARTDGHVRWCTQAFAHADSQKRTPPVDSLTHTAKDTFTQVTALRRNEGQCWNDSRTEEEPVDYIHRKRARDVTQRSAAGLVYWVQTLSLSVQFCTNKPKRELIIRSVFKGHT